MSSYVDLGLFELLVLSTWLFILGFIVAIHIEILKIRKAITNKLPKTNDLVEIQKEEERMKTMDEVYEDGSSHKYCEQCGLCIDCGDCKCKQSSGSLE